MRRKWRPREHSTEGIRRSEGVFSLGVALNEVRKWMFGPGRAEWCPTVEDVS
jgi:hypothetical protein